MTTRRSADAPRPTPKPSTWRAAVEFPSDVPGLPPSEGFGDAAAALGVAFEPGDVERLGRYLALLLEAGKSVNLTAIRDPAEAWTKHVLDSLTLLPLAAEASGRGGSGGENDAETEAVSDDQRDGVGTRIIDVGTGGGLPGVPLAIALPGAHVTLLDATEKKCRFLEHAARELGLENVTVLHDRAEAAGQRRGARRDGDHATTRRGAMRGAFDLVVARAVGRLPVLLELTVPLARVGGLCALVKGARADEELADAGGALRLLHASHAGTIDTPTGRVVVIEKRRATPRAYPRASGEPKKHPLGLPPRSRTSA